MTSERKIGAQAIESGRADALDDEEVIGSEEGAVRLSMLDDRERPRGADGGEAFKFDGGCVIYVD